MKYMFLFISLLGLSCSHFSQRLEKANRQPSAIAGSSAFFRIDPFVVQKEGMSKAGQKLTFISLEMTGLMAKLRERAPTTSNLFSVNFRGLIGTDDNNLYPLYEIIGNTSSNSDPCRDRPLKILITSGTHGNEPIGVITAFDLINDLSSQNPQLQISASWSVMPLLNVEGLAKAKRLMNNMKNLNREFDVKTWSKTSKAIAAVWQNKDFDVSIDLHGSNIRKQFFLIKTSADDHGAGERALAAVKPELLLHTEEGKTTGYVGAPAENDTIDNERYRLESAGLASSSNEGTIKNYLQSQGTKYAYTLEYPGSLGYELVRANNFTLLKSLIQEVAKEVCRR